MGTRICGFLIIVAVALGVSGCASTTTSNDAPKEPERPTYVPPRADLSDNATIVVNSGDGNFPFVLDGYQLPLRGSSGKTVTILLRPGVHNIVTSWFLNGMYSIQSAELTFAAQPGRVYQLQKWPPQIVDQKTFQVAEVHTRVWP